jgi:hypothetical protein
MPALNRRFDYDHKNPASAIGRPVYGNNVKHLGRIIAVEPALPHCYSPRFVIKWRNGQTTTLEDGQIGDIEGDIASMSYRLNEMMAARERALS